MPKKKKSNSGIDENRERIQQGIGILKQHPLFEKFIWRITFRTSENMARTEYVFVNGTGGIRINEKVRLEPEQWAHLLAHACLHLAF